jgi:hypothetical protein
LCIAQLNSIHPTGEGVLMAALSKIAFYQTTCGGAWSGGELVTYQQA